MQEQATGTVQQFGQLSRHDLREIFGLDCPEALEWRHWQPGGEYIKNLVLKNVTTKTIKLKYKLTPTKVFSMDYPELIKLSAGMSFPIRVVFRPVKQEEYSDRVEFVCGDRSFILTIKALLPATHLEVPTHIDFGFVPSKETAIIPFTVRNIGDVKVDFEWVLEAPFSVKPHAATLTPGATSDFQCFFEPQDAASFTGTALCKLETGASAIVQVSGIAKFPYLSIEQSTVDFGSVLVGQTVERSFRFGNHSTVAANFSVQHEDAAGDAVFTVNPSKGTLGPDEYSMIKVTYAPKHTGTFSCENFTISTPGGNKLTLNLRGAAAGPVATFSTRSFNFGNVAAGQPTSRVLYMQNHSDVNMVYEFDLDPLDVFVFSRLKGSIPARTTGHVTITFKCAAPANYWRRVPCIIKDADPIAIDLVATCFDEKTRPPPISHRHISSYMARVAEGGPPVPTAAAGQGEGAAEATGTVALLNTLAPTDLSETNQAIQDLPGPDSWELFFEGQDPAAAVTVDEPLLDFGTTSRLSTSEYKTVTVTNRTDGKLLAFISVPTWQDPTGGEPKPVFQIFPEQAEIKPRGQVSFRVAFRPPRDGHYYSCGLHLVAFVKSMRNFRLVAETGMVPPWSVPITAMGNTFLHCHPEHSPKVKVSHGLVVFPPCRPGECVHQTLQLLNYGDTPVHFSFQGALAGVFNIKPDTGVVPPGTHCLVGLRFSPLEPRQHAAKVMCIFNGSAANASELQLRGAAHLPRLAMDAAAGSSMFFRPTCIGASSQRALTMHNPSRVPVAFKWQLPSRAAGVVEVVPSSGVLRGNESCQVQWTFRPAKQKKYEFRVACAMFMPGDEAETPAEDGASPEPSQQQQPEKLDQLSVQVVGEGTVGAITMEPRELQLGPVSVGYPVKRAVTLVNQSDGILRYTIEITRASTGGPAAEAESDDLGVAVQWRKSGVQGDVTQEGEWWVDEPEGAIAAKASKLVHVTLLPRHRRLYNLEMQVRSATVSALSAAPGCRPGSASNGSFTKKLPPLGHSAGASAAGSSEAAAPAVAPIIAHAQFPAVAVTDVASDGCPKQVLWEMLGISALNKELGARVTQLDLDLDEMEEKGSLITELASRSLQPFPIDFGPRGHGCAPLSFHVRLSNTAALPCHWEFHSYDDPQLEMENWVEPGAPSNEAEKHRDFIVEAKLFDVQPRNGNLAPGEAAVVTFVYNPTHLGSHTWPIFFHVNDGKRIHFLMTGSTVSPSVQHLPLLPSTRTFTFEPVPIGDTSAPRQMMTLRNAGPAPLTWSIDLAPLEQFTADNHGFKVLQCTSPASGQMLPGHAAPINWVFTPVEAKEYSITLDVRTGDGSLERVTLSGRGYHPKRREESLELPQEGDRRWTLWPHFSPLARLSLPGHLVTLDRDVIDLKTILVQGVVRQLLQLTNRSCYTLLYTWHMGMFEAEKGAVAGQLSISPAAGRLAPGEQLLCRITFTAGLQTQLLEGEVHCVAEVDPQETINRTAAKQPRSSYMAGNFPLKHGGNMLVLDHEDSRTGQGDELIAESPARDHTRPKPGTLLRNRLPVASSMTTSLRNRFEPLAQRYNDTINSITQRGLDANRPTPTPEPQLITVTVCGRILSQDHIKAGAFIPEAEREAAAQLLSGRAWVLPLQQPFWAPQLEENHWLEQQVASTSRRTSPLRERLMASGTMTPVSGSATPRQDSEFGAPSPPRYTSMHDMSRSVELATREAVMKQRAARAMDPADSGYQAAVSVLTTALSEALQDPDILATLDALDTAPIPLFAEVRAEVPWPYLRPQPAGEPSGQPSHDAAAAAAAGSTPDSAAALGSPAASSTQVPDAATAGRSSSDVSAGISGDSMAAAVGSGRDEQDDADLDALRSDPDFCMLAEYVADSALLALVHESVAGDWNLVEAL